MFTLIDILVVIASAIVGGLFTYLVLYTRYIKELNSIMERIEKASRDYNEALNTADKLITHYRKTISFSHGELIRLRDAGHSDLDEIIGALGEALDY